ncbi:MAG: hypothetical protein ABSF35_15620 [Polyangia bacterium]|jgi:hypothetical protein
MDNRREGVLTLGLFVVCSLATIGSIVAADLQVGVDMPTHLSMLRILRLAFEDPAAFHATYGARVLQPYWGYYAPVLLFSTVLPLDLAAKFVTGLTLVGIPISMALLARREGLRPMVALPAFAFCWNYCYWWGFVPFLCGVVAALFGLLVVLRYAQSPGLRNLGLLCLVSLGVFTAHALAWLLFAVSSLWLVLAQVSRASWRRLAASTLAFVLPAVLMTVWNRRLEKMVFFKAVLEHPVHVGLDFKVWSFPHVAFPSAEPAMERLLLGLWLLVLVLAMVGRFDAARRRQLFRWGGLALVMVVGFWILPQDMAGISFLYQRPLFLALLFPLLCAPRTLRFPRPCFGAGLTIVALNLVFSTLTIRGFNHEMKDAQACLSHARPHSSLMGLMLDRTSFAGSDPLFLHVDNYHAYWNLGRVYAHSMEVVPTTPVYYKQRDFFYGPAPGFEWNPLSFQAAYGKNVDYFFIHAPVYLEIEGLGRVPVDRLLLKQALQESELVCSEGAWRLYAHFGHS